MFQQIWNFRAPADSGRSARPLERAAEKAREIKESGASCDSIESQLPLFPRRPHLEQGLAERLALGDRVEGLSVVRERVSRVDVDA